MATLSSPQSCHKASCHLPDLACRTAESRRKPWLKSGLSLQSQIHMTGGGEGRGGSCSGSNSPAGNGDGVESWTVSCWIVWNDMAGRGTTGIRRESRMMAGVGSNPIGLMEIMMAVYRLWPSKWLIRILHLFSSSGS